MIIQGDFKDPLFRKVLIEGTPKDAGKTTFAYSAGVFGSVLGLQFDMGNPTIPPGVPQEGVTVKVYDAAQPDAKSDSTNWHHDKSVGEEIIKDIMEIRRAGRDKSPIKLGELVVPWPRTLVLDGAVGLAESVLSWILGTNRAFGAEDFGASGKGRSNRYALWGQRLSKLQYIYSMLIPLPCNVILITWLTPETTKQGEDSVNTGNFLPDIGGKLDIQGSGKFDSTLRLYSVKTNLGVKYFAQAAGGTTYPGLGIRGKYDWNGWTDGSIEVTIKPGQPLPYERVFGKMREEER